MIKTVFSEWTRTKLDDTFQMEQVDTLPSLEAWMKYSYDLDEFEQRYLLKLQRTLIIGVDDWNEVELENKFISPLIVFADIDTRKYAYFMERVLTGVIGNYELSGRVDGLIASGFREPKKPYFCLAEYKKDTDAGGEPAGQALAAMLVAQSLNENNIPMYGCYVKGRVWYFMCLEEKKYAISHAYRADGNEIFDIYTMIRGLQNYIATYTN